MIFNEIFYKNRRKPNDLLFVRQAGELINDISYNISRTDSPTHTVGMLKIGRLIIKTDSEECILKPGQSVFFPRNTAYTITADKSAPPHFCWINIRGKLIDNISEAIFDGKFVLSEADTRDWMNDLKELMSAEQDCDTEISVLVFKMLLNILKYKITADLHKNKTSEFEFYISNSIQMGFSVSAMADYFNCSTDTINRSFKAEFGITPYQYYHNLRIEIAKSMLLNTKMTIEDISERLYFSDRNHFSLCFKKKTGYAPAMYRKCFIKKEYENMI